MIVVTGTKRSGTSMWMQVLRAAGVPSIGEAFPRVWEESIREANPRGFYESRFRSGINYRTNPDPKTGDYLPPGATRDTAVKVFIPGLVRSDVAYLRRVIGTIRPWREYCTSWSRLLHLEQEWKKGRNAGAVEGANEVADPAPLPHPAPSPEAVALPTAVEWWFENYELVRDVSTRRYAFTFVSYDAMLRDPAAIVHKVVPWLGVGDADAAIAAVAPLLRTQNAPSDPHAVDAGLSDAELRVFDDLYTEIDRGAQLPASLLNDMNAVQTSLLTKYNKLELERDVR
jgi:hypothetical protein